MEIENIFKELLLVRLMRKRVFLGLVVTLSVMIFASFAFSASSDYEDEINSAFSCLDNKVGSATLSLEEAVFSALANVPDDKVNNTIVQKKNPNEFCWPSSGCDIKDTARVALAKLSMGESVGNITDWLKSKAGSTEDLTWYLQIIIDNNGPSDCIVNYDGTDHSISIDEDMGLSGSPGSCLTITGSGNWLRVSDSCLEKEFQTQCAYSFKTNLLYEKSTGGILYVSPETHTASGDGEIEHSGWTSEEINARCFKEGSSCDYEASLWAAVALYADGKEIGEFAPYLKALASENQEYFPSAFLLAMLAGSDDHYSEIIESKKIRPEGAYWDIGGSPYSKYYDTSLAMLALGGADSPEIDSANVLGYLFTHQDDSGCWNGGNIRDTAFVIWSAKWLRGDYVAPPDPECGDGTRNGGEACEGADLGGETCVSLDYESGNLSCVSAGSTDECTFDVGECVGEVYPDCGDGVINGSEVCDGTNLTGQNCTTKGYLSGTLGCADDCLTFDVSNCQGDVGPPPGPGSECGSGHLELCLDESNCTGAGGYWYNETCNQYEEGTGPGWNPGLVTDCELAQLFCAPSRSACLEAEGSFWPQETHSCENPFEFCCSVEVPEQNCAGLGGQVCQWDETCTGSVVQASDGACCQDLCEPIGVGSCTSDSDCPSEMICNNYGECVSGSEPPSGCSNDFDCADGEECIDGYCVEKGGSLWIWIIILIILILLVILGIVFKDKMRVWWFKITKKTKTSRVRPGMPPGGPGPMGRRPTPRFGLPGRRPMAGMPPRRPPTRPPASGSAKQPQKPKEDDDTFKKLKEMSK